MMVMPASQRPQDPDALAELPDQMLKSDRDLRIQVTSTVWKTLLPALGICIPLALVTESGGLLPFSLIAGATVVTIVIWKPTAKGPEVNSYNRNLIANTPQDNLSIGLLLSRKRSDFALAIFSAVVGALVSVVAGAASTPLAAWLAGILR